MGTLLIRGGKIITMSEVGVIQNFNEEDVADCMTEEVKRSWSASSPYAEIIKELEPYLMRYYEKFEAVALKHHYQYNTA